MKKLHEVKHAWIWKKNGTTYKATLYSNTFTIRDANTKYGLILQIRNLTIDSQNNIIKNMHKIKFSLECDV